MKVTEHFPYVSDDIKQLLIFTIQKSLFKKYVHMG